MSNLYTPSKFPMSWRQNRLQFYPAKVDHSIVGGIPFRPTPPVTLLGLAVREP